ncbi:MAG TPA: STAS domain-containing protein, partial [Kofleriaceae bacterium]
DTIAKTGATGLVIDITGLEIVDSYVARVLANTGRMAALMGTDTVVVGMRPVVAATLVRMGFRMEGVRTALDVDDGLALISDLLARRHSGG